MAASWRSRVHSHFIWRLRSRAPWRGARRSALRRALAVLGLALDLNALANLLPGHVDQMLLKPGEPSFGRADQVLHRAIALTHLGETSSVGVPRSITQMRRALP